jgi:hypothetical protein
MSRTYGNERNSSQLTNSFQPTASFLQTRPFAPIQTDLDEDAPRRPSGYTENFLEKIINQRSTESSDTPVQAKPMNRLRRPLQDKRVSMIQAKLNIGEPNDKYEQEADATASKVVQQINSPIQDQSVQKQESMEEEEELQMKPISSIQREAAIGEEEELQMKSLVQRRENFGGGEASTDLESSIQSARSSGQSLDPNLQEKMGQAMGADFSSVKVHTDSQSDQLNKSIQAKAFTTGQDIFFRQGEYNPSSTGGQELLAHELTHVVQQNGSTVQRRKKVQMKPDLQLHQEEDEVQMKPDLQLHQEEDEVQMKPDLQLHQEEDEVQMKPDLQLKESSSGCTSGCQCSSCSPSSTTVQRKISTSQTNASQNLLNRKLIDMVQQDGTQIQRFSNSSNHASGCSCSDCGSSSAKIQRKSEGTHESGCSCPMCSGEGQKVQAKFEVNRVPSVSISPASNNTPVIQRHAAYEHYMLGQVDPSDLSNIPMVREIPQLEKQLDELEKQRKKSKSKNIVAEELTLGVKIEEANKKKKTVRHTLNQEMERLWAFKTNPEVLSNKNGEVGKVEKDDDQKWQVPIVKLPVKGDGKDAVAGDTSIIVSYSEINTFPDFFGNPETIANTKKSAVLKLLQGVRQQAYIEVSNIYKEIFGEDKNKLSNWSEREYLGVTQGDFEGAVGPRGQAVNEFVYEKHTEMAVNSTTKRDKTEEKSQEYFAALERNACHFAPYSWQQWESYHTKARKLAAASALGMQNVEDMRDLGGVETVIAQEEQQALEESNQALLQNAFGEHYLQDSFAAGHLIDKTGVMQAFTQWINANGKALGSTDNAKSQFAMASMIANKKGLKSNPQALDDKMMRGELDSVGEATDEVGLGATEDIIFMMWWRKAANDDKGDKHLTPDQAATKCTISSVKGNPGKAKQLMEALVSQHFAKIKTSGVINKTQFYSLDESQVDVLKGKGAYKAELAMKLHSGEDGDTDYDDKDYDFTDKAYTKEAEEFNLAAYNEFMGNAYIQGATKFFHDKYCKEGLEVITGEGASIGRIYGDANMLNAGGQKGVEYAAKTSQMSREAIFNIINDTPGEAASVAKIKNRFPTTVIVPKFGPRPLENWNFQFLYTDALFKEAATFGAKIAYKAMGGISGGNAINVGEIVKHDGDIF